MSQSKTEASSLKRFIDLPAPGWMAVSRGAGFGLAILLALNLMEVLVHSTSAVENWLTDLRPLSQPMGIAILAMASTSLLMFGMRPALPGPVQFSAFLLVAVFSGFCGRELWQVSRMAQEADRITASIQPMGVLMFFVVTAMGILSGNSVSVRGYSSWIAIFISTLLTILCFAIIAIQSGSLPDSSPPESVPAVLVISDSLDGTESLSDELRDRLTTACGLIKAKSADRLLLEEGSSYAAMKTFALESEVPEECIEPIKDASNIETAVRIAATRAAADSDRRIMIVSHWYELARIRILAKQSGLQVFAVPADQKHALFNQNMRVAREASALLKTMIAPTMTYFRNGQAPVAAN